MASLDGRGGVRGRSGAPNIYGAGCGAMVRADPYGEQCPGLRSIFLRSRLRSDRARYRRVLLDCRKRHGREVTLIGGGAPAVPRRADRPTAAERTAASV